MVKKLLEDGHARKRSAAWIYYAVLAVLSFIVGVSVNPSGLLGALLFGSYSIYLFRGGRIVFWIW